MRFLLSWLESMVPKRRLSVPCNNTIISMENRVITKSSPELYEFYKEYAKWLNGDSTYPFSKINGLCVNLYDYAYTMGYMPEDLSTEMHEQFKDAGLDDFLPFNGYELPPYRWETENGLAHKNTHRVRWVLDRVKEYEEKA